MHTILHLFFRFKNIIWRFDEKQQKSRVCMLVIENDVFLETVMCIL